MENQKPEKNPPVELEDGELETVSGGTATTVPIEVKYAQLKMLRYQNPNLTAEELYALYAETYGTDFYENRPTNADFLISLPLSDLFI